MGTILADAFLDRASTLLVDRLKKRWPDSTLLRWGNDGQLAILQVRPDAYTETRVVELAAGTRQSLAAEDFELFDVARNMGTNGSTPGMVCTFIDRKQLDLSNPLWHSAKASATVRHWMYDRAVPKTWWCYPPQPATGRGYVELDVSTAPPAMTIQGIEEAAETTPIGLDDIYLNPLLQFVLYRAYSEDSEYTAAGGKAVLAYEEFLQTLGIKTETNKRFIPQKNQAPRYEAPPKTDDQGAFGAP